MYLSGSYTTESIANQFGITPRSVQRLAKKHNVIRTQNESNKLMAQHKNYYRKPEHLKVRRKQLPNKHRLLIIRNHPYCTVCGNTVNQGVRLEIDHIDENPMNNVKSNLQVLCNLCNVGKSQLARFGV